MFPSPEMELSRYLGHRRRRYSGVDNVSPFDYFVCVSIFPIFLKTQRSIDIALFLLHIFVSLFPISGAVGGHKSVFKLCKKDQ